MMLNFDLWLPKISFIVLGIVVNIKYTILAVSLGICFGVVVSLMQFSNIFYVRLLSKIYVSIFRGTPIVVQLFIIFYVLPFKFDQFHSGVIAFALNSAAYVSEIFRAGIKSIDVGQFEAAHALGINKYYTMKDIILPQAIKNIMPALGNEVVNMLKETAVLSMIGEEDIMRRAQAVGGESYSYFVPLMTAAITYYILILSLSGVLKYIEKRYI